MTNLIEQVVAGLPAATRVLEMGCGSKRIWPGSVTVDRNLRSVADVLHDLNQLPYPFADNEFDVVIAQHVIEHLEDVIAVVEEVHRILKPNGLWLIEVPHFSSHHFYTDPTHRHPFGARSFDYFVPAPGGCYMFHYANANFRKRRVHLTGPKSSLLHRYLYALANRNPYRYKSELTWIFPLETITFELEALKYDVE